MKKIDFTVESLQQKWKSLSSEQKKEWLVSDEGEAWYEALVKSYEEGTNVWTEWNQAQKQKRTKKHIQIKEVLEEEFKQLRETVIGKSDRLEGRLGWLVGYKRINPDNELTLKHIFGKKDHQQIALNGDWMWLMNGVWSALLEENEELLEAPLKMMVNDYGLNLHDWEERWKTIKQSIKECDMYDDEDELEYSNHFLKQVLDQVFQAVSQGTVMEEKALKEGLKNAKLHYKAMIEREEIGILNTHRVWADREVNTRENAHWISLWISDEFETVGYSSVASQDLSKWRALLEAKKLNERGLKQKNDKMVKRVINGWKMKKGAWVPVSWTEHESGVQGVNQKSEQTEGLEYSVQYKEPGVKSKEVIQIKRVSRGIMKKWDDDWVGDRMLMLGKFNTNLEGWGLKGLMAEHPEEEIRNAAQEWAKCLGVDWNENEWIETKKKYQWMSAIEGAHGGVENRWEEMTGGYTYKDTWEGVMEKESARWGKAKGWGSGNMEWALITAGVRKMMNKQWEDEWRKIQEETVQKKNSRGEDTEGSGENENRVEWRQETLKSLERVLVKKGIEIRDGLGLGVGVLGQFKSLLDEEYGVGSGLWKSWVKSEEVLKKRVVELDPHLNEEWSKEAKGMGSRKPKVQDTRGTGVIPNKGWSAWEKEQQRGVINRLKQACVELDKEETREKGRSWARFQMKCREWGIERESEKGEALNQWWRDMQDKPGLGQMIALWDGKASWERNEERLKKEMKRWEMAKESWMDSLMKELHGKWDQMLETRIKRIREESGSKKKAVEVTPAVLSRLSKEVKKEIQALLDTARDAYKGCAYRNEQGGYAAVDWTSKTPLSTLLKLHEEWMEREAKKEMEKEMEKTPHVIMQSVLQEGIQKGWLTQTINDQVNDQEEWKTVMEKEGVEVEELHSLYALKQEGKKMSHCIGSYGEDLRGGRFVAFHLKETMTQEESTLSFDLILKNGKNQWDMNQHLGKRNGAVRSQRLEEVAEELRVLMNKSKVNKRKRLLNENRNKPKEMEMKKVKR